MAGRVIAFSMSVSYILFEKEEEKEWNRVKRIYQRPLLAKEYKSSEFTVLSMLSSSSLLLFTPLGQPRWDWATTTPQILNQDAIVPLSIIVDQCVCIRD